MRHSGHGTSQRNQGHFSKHKAPEGTQIPNTPQSRDEAATNMSSVPSTEWTSQPLCGQERGLGPAQALCDLGQAVPSLSLRHSTLALPTKL